MGGIRARQTLPRLGLAFCLSGLVASCSHGRLERGSFIKSDVRYRIGEVPPGWKLVKLSGNDLAYQAVDSGHVMAVNSTCRDFEDAPLPVLTRQLLMGFSDRQLIQQETHPLDDGRDALFSRYDAKLDGVPTELQLVVMKKDGCVYDFIYLSPPGRFDEKRAVFDALLSQFRVEARH